ncbi:YdeI/OmpD-associated family protein [Oleiharenicola lentus]|uniref:YdeI/OmpD-associated family protein n=1 Tax=Oleiharenicola lentus TaxID=2508720 RepID=UPI003F675ADF
MKPSFFKTQALFREWLEANHATSTEFFVGFYKKTSGKGGLTWQEAVDEALCFGWIDGVMKSLGPESYMHRFTPRRAGSTWSNINVAHVARLTAAGKMHSAGVKAFEARTTGKTGIYRYEQATPASLIEKFPTALEKNFRAAKAAWKHWEASPPGYRRRQTDWVASAKQAATQQARLARLIAAHAAGRRLL